MEPRYVKTGFCPEEVVQMERLISMGFGKNKSDLVRKAMIEFIDRNRQLPREGKHRNHELIDLAS